MPAGLTTAALKPLTDLRTSDFSPTTVSATLDLPDGKATTIYISSFPRANTALRLAVFDEAEPLLAWCGRTQIDFAIVGGFFMRGKRLPVGEVWMRGTRIESHLGEWAAARGTLFAYRDELRIAPRAELPAEPEGELIQAGPQLVAGGTSLIFPGAPLDSFPKTWRRTNDTDITKGRYPRTAIGYDHKRLWVVACDGQPTIPANLVKPLPDAGLSLGELAEVMVALGAHEALNLDGGGSTSMIFERRLLNRPKAGLRDKGRRLGETLEQGRPVHSAIAFLPR